MKKIIESGEIMAYKYESVLKSFEYSTESYQVISEFLLSGDKTNPNVMLKVTEISKHFNKRPNDWFAISTVVDFIKALVQIKLDNQDKLFIKAFIKWTKNENITVTSLNGNGKNNDFSAILSILNSKQLLKLIKEIGLVSVKQGGDNKEGKALQGTWIHRDLAIEYARWLDPKFSIWISQKILELVNDGVAWNEIRNKTKKIICL